MIIPKKGQNVGKRNKNFLFSKTTKGDFELKDFSNIANLSRRKSNKSFRFMNFLKTFI